MLSDAFWASVDKTAGCWVWTGRGNPDNYGLYSIHRKPHRVHVMAWEDVNGPVPAGMVLDHLCHTNACELGSQCPHRRCVRLDHMQVTTVKINTLRGTGPTAVNKLKTHCDRGHLFDEANTQWRPQGWRTCRACRRNRVDNRKRARGGQEAGQ